MVLLLLQSLQYWSPWMCCCELKVVLKLVLIQLLLGYLCCCHLKKTPKLVLMHLLLGCLETVGPPYPRLLLMDLLVDLLFGHLETEVLLIPLIHSGHMQICRPQPVLLASVIGWQELTELSDWMHMDQAGGWHTAAEQLRLGRTESSGPELSRGH